jgi:hypothetical protein
MAGIQVHTSSPINPNAAKAAGITPTTTQPTDTTNQSRPVYTPASATAASSVYSPARPGAAPGPAPTGAAQSSNLFPTATVPPAPTQTSNVPPPPQPGAIPSPFVAPALPVTRARRHSIPPPPKAGELPKPAAYYAPHYEQEQQYQRSPYSPQTRRPPQMNAMLSTPTCAIPPSSTTSTPAYADLSNPPGYVQNSRDSFDERSGMHSPYQNQGYGNNSAHRGGLLASGRDVAPPEESPIAQAWRTATGWAKTAGEKLKEGEEEVWRRINEK